MGVLVVDDQSYIRRLLCQIVRQADVGTVYEAPNGEQAIEILQQRADIDLLITDLFMTPINGFQVIRHVRRNLRGRESMKVIGITGSSTPEAVFHARLAGVDRTLVKPFSTNVVVEAMVDAMGKTREIVRQGDYIGPPLKEPKQNAAGVDTLLPRWSQLASKYADALSPPMPKRAVAAGDPGADPTLEDSMSDAEIEALIDGSYGKLPAFN